MSRKKIAVFSTAWAGEILYKYLMGASEALSAISADMYLFTCHAAFYDNIEYKKGELHIYDLPNMNDFDAALLFGNGLDYQEIIDKISQACIKAKIPLIYTGREDDRFYFVGADNYVGTKDLTEHLITEHHVENVWFIAGSLENMDSNTRLQAVSDVLASHGHVLSESDIYYSQWSPFLAFTYVNERLDKGDPLPDAIICANDTLAMMICSELRKRGINVPEDIIVTGFDNEYYAQIYDPSISSVDQRFDKIGRKCAELLIDILDGKNVAQKHSIPCEFVPSESCGCYSAKDFNKIRRKIGQEQFDLKIHNSQFDIKLTIIERNILSTKSYSKLGDSLKTVCENNTDFEGSTFYVILDPLFEKTIVDQQTPLHINTYPKKMHAVFSKDNGVVATNTMINTKDLFPTLAPVDKNRFYILEPLHDNEYSFGYLVFGDDIEKMKNSIALRKYIERFNIAIGKFYQNMRMDVLNQRLFQMTETDALTHVKNRTAFIAKEEELQKLINANESTAFALVLFDINNLKYINDNLGHEAGDEYIINSSQLICNTFKKSAVYRIGGDEFVAVLQNDDYKNREKLLAKMKKKMNSLKESNGSVCEKISIASGISVYDPKTDRNVSDIFNRADAIMYENKAYMKRSIFFT